MEAHLSTRRPLEHRELPRFQGLGVLDPKPDGGHQLSDDVGIEDEPYGRWTKACNT